MLSSFLKHQDIPEVREMCEKLSLLKRRIIAENLNDPFFEYQCIKTKLAALKDWALAHNDEKFANSQLVFERYFLIFCNLAKYRNCLLCGDYRESWNVLQDCLDNARFVGRFTPIEQRLDVPSIVSLLEDYEHLYPYTLFFSSEFVVSKSHCSICGKSMQNLSCRHRKGEIYRGEVATEIVDDIREIQAICIVKNPDKKRCVFENINGKPLSFNMLEDFRDLGFPWLQRFSIKKEVEIKTDTNIKRTSRNNPCTCGSGLKFKKCCGKNIYRDHLRCTVIPGAQVDLAMI